MAKITTLTAEQEFQLEDLVADVLVSELEQKCPFLTPELSVESIKKQLENRLRIKGLTAKNLNLTDVKDAVNTVLNNYSELPRVEAWILSTGFKTECGVSTATIHLKFRKAVTVFEPDL